MVKFEINTESLTTEEARALALFFLEVRNIDRASLDVGAVDARDTVVDASDERAGDTSTGQGTVPEGARRPGRTKWTNGGAAAGSVPKEAPVFILANKKTGVSIECNSGRKGDVEAAKGHFETWLRDAGSVEEVAGLAADNESFAATCLTKKEQTAIAKLVAEVKQSFAPDVQQRVAAEAKAGEPAKPVSNYTIDSVKAAGRALASAKGLPAVETVLAKFGVKTFKDVKEADFAGVVQALDAGLA